MRVKQKTRYLRDIHLVDNYGTYEYYLGDSKSRWYPDTDGRVYTWQWPDGHTAAAPIAQREAYQTMSDMGQTYRARTTEYCLAVNIHGVQVLIPIQKLQVYI